MFDNLKDKLGQAKGRALRAAKDIKDINVIDYVDKIKDTKDDVLNRIDDLKDSFDTKGQVQEYVKKPVKIYAAEYVYPLSDELKRWMGLSAGKQHKNKGHPGEMEIMTLEDGTHLQVTHIATEGDMIIQGIQGEFYACKPDIFRDSYKKA